MTTYAESVGRAPFDWGAFLAADNYTAGEWIEATGRASCWPTCACGNQCDALPRDEYGRPTDFELAKLGGVFCANIAAHDLPAARATFARIEARSAELLAEMGK